MILSGICFLIVNFFVKILGSNSGLLDEYNLQKYPAHELVLARSIVSFAISAIIIKQRKLPFFGVNKKWLIIRGLSGTIALTLFFATILHLPLAVAAIIHYLAPIFTVLLTIYFIGEKVSSRRWLFIFISFSGVGVIFIAKMLNLKLNLDLPIEWLVAGVISALFSGLAYTAIVKLKSTDQPINIVLYFPMIAIPIMSFLCLFEFTMPRGIEWFILLTIGIFTQIAQILLTRAFHEGDASVIAPVQYLGAIYAFLVGLFIFDEKLSWIIEIGIFLILFGVLSNALLQLKKKY